MLLNLASPYRFLTILRHLFSSCRLQLYLFLRFQAFRERCSSLMKSSELLEKFLLHVLSRSARALFLFAGRRGGVSAVCGSFPLWIPGEGNAFMRQGNVNFYDDSPIIFREYLRTYIHNL